MTPELEKIDAEIADAERLLRDGHPDVSGLTMALKDWRTERRLLTVDIYIPCLIQFKV